MCDTRLLRFRAPEGQPAPVLLRLQTDLSDPDATAFATILEKLGTSLRSVTIAFEGTGLSVPFGSLLVPDVLIDWVGEQKTAIPGANRVAEDAFSGLVPNLVVGGALLSVPHASVLASDRV